MTKLPQASYEATFVAKEAGYVESIIADEVGVAAMLLGAGRATKEDKIDFAAGITLEKKVGDRVEVGDVIAVLRSNIEDMSSAIERLDHAYTIGATKPEARPLVHAVIQ